MLLLPDLPSRITIWCWPFDSLALFGCSSNTNHFISSFINGISQPGIACSSYMLKKSPNLFLYSKKALIWLKLSMCNACNSSNVTELIFFFLVCSIPISFDKFCSDGSLNGSCSSSCLDNCSCAHVS